MKFDYVVLTIRQKPKPNATWENNKLGYKKMKVSLIKIVFEKKKEGMFFWHWF